MRSASLTRPLPLPLALATLVGVGCGDSSAPEDPGPEADIALIASGFLACGATCSVGALEIVDLRGEMPAAGFACEGGPLSFGVDFLINDEVVEQRQAECGVADGGTGSGTVATTSPWVPPDSGTYTLRIVLDPRNEVTESDETNNEASHVFDVLLPDPVVVAAGPSSTCGTWAHGAAYCWGANTDGQLGTGGTSTRLAPAVVATTDDLTGVTGTFGAHRCATRPPSVDEPPMCWGANAQGQLGTGSFSSSSVPADVDVSRVLHVMAAGGTHTCGLWAATELYCWGDNTHGQLGIGDTPATANTPQLVPVADYQTVVAGARHSCALAQDGAAFCWGSNQFGQLGTGAIGGTETGPAAVVGGLLFDRLAAGAFHTCGVTTDGDTVCWGSNAFGQLGGASAEVCTDDDSNPVDCSSTALSVSGGHAFAVVYAGEGHTCGLVADTGAAHCWGNGADGQLGNGAAASSTAPVAVSGGLTFNHLSLGSGHTCGLSDNRIYCWGRNGDGQLGTGTTDPSDVPVRVADPFWGTSD